MLHLSVPVKLVKYITFHAVDFPFFFDENVP